MTQLTENMSDRFIARYAYTAAGLIEYIGYANPGSAEGDLVWQIRKMVYTGTSITQTNFADGSRSFEKSWTSRASYTYK
jgi:hypothetical protein